MSNGQFYKNVLSKFRPVWHFKISSAIKKVIIAFFKPFLKLEISKKAKLYIPSNLNIDFILLPTQLIVCACSKMLDYGSNHGLFLSPYTLPYTLNCMSVSLFKFHI